MADSKVSDLTAADDVDDADLFHLVKGGVDKKATAAQMRAASIPTSALDTDVALTANSDTRVPSQKAVAAFVAANVGGESAIRFVDVVITPDMLVSAPYYDPDKTGPGLVVVEAPAANEILMPVKVLCLTTAGDVWDADSSPKMAWGDTDGQDLEAVMSGATLPSDYSPDDPAFTNFPLITVADLYEAAGAIGGALFAGNDGGNPSSGMLAGLPLVMWSEVDITNGGTVFGTRSLVYRVWYQVFAIPTLDTYFRITDLVQVAKTFTVTDADEALDGATGTFTVVGSTGNNGTYTIVSAVSATGDTVITVVEAIPHATADGWVKL